MLSQDTTWCCSTCRATCPPSLTAAPSRRARSRRSWAASRHGTPAPCAPTGRFKLKWKRWDRFRDLCLTRVTVCRICSGCASVDVPDYKDKDKFKMENLLIGQFMKQVTSGPKVTTWSKSDASWSLFIFSLQRKFQRLRAGPRLSRGKFPNWEKKWEETSVI